MALFAAWAYLDIDNPLVAWMAYRGQLASATEVHEYALSFWLARLLARSRSAARDYATEVAVEVERQATFPSAVSRLRGFYLFPDKGAAMGALRWGGPFRRENLVEVAILEGSRWSRHDSGWWAETPGGWMRRYLSGAPAGPQPMWELVVEGRGRVIGTDARERARAVVERTWPRSLAMLELARIGCSLNSDLGVIVPMFIGSESLSIRYVMNFLDAENPAFLERFERLMRENPELVDHAALRLADAHGLVVPDLQDREVHLT